MSNKRQTVLVCEGYDDRAFLSGWLVRLGSPEPKRGLKVCDPWGLEVKDGAYGFYAPTGRFARVVPAMGDTNTKRTLRKFVKDNATAPCDQIVLCLDSDADADQPCSRLLSIRGMVEDIGRGLGLLTASQSCSTEPPFTLGDTQVHPLIWSCDDPSDTPGVPNKQTLERLVVASIVATYPDRAAPVSAFLAAKPDGGTDHKAHAMSYFAKWQAGDGTDWFYRGVWEDARVAAELKRRLEISGAWQVIEALLT